MAEKFEVKFNKVCPACSASCPQLELETESWTVHNPLLGVIRQTRSKCKNEDICQNCWNRSIRALNSIGDDVPMRTNWGNRRDKKEMDLLRYITQTEP